MRGHRARALFAYIGAIFAIVALPACSPFHRDYGPGMAPNPTPPEIRAPGFRLLPDPSGTVDSPPFRQNGGAYQILVSQTTFSQFTSDIHIDTYVSWLDGTDRRKIALKYPCDTGEYAVSADGMWLACLANGATSADNNPTYYLETASLSAGDSPRHAAIRLDALTDYRLPVWSPDGAYLALVRSSHTTGPCSIQVFAVSTDHSSATWRTTLNAPATVAANGVAFQDPPLCGVARLGWSSDGARLLILLFGTTSPNSTGKLAPGLFLSYSQVPIGALIRSGTGAATLSTTDFTPFGPLAGPAAISAQLHPYVWNPVTGVLALISGNAFANGNPAQIALYTPGQREAQTIFTLPYRGFTILSLDWSSDGSSLLVGVGGITCGECGFGVQSWYLYTPGGQ